MFFVVGKRIWDKVVEVFFLDAVRYEKSYIPFHCFDSLIMKVKNAFAFFFPFQQKASKNEKLNFMIHVDVIDESLRYLIGIPSLCSKWANTNYEILNMSFTVQGVYLEAKLHMDHYHL